MEKPMEMRDVDDAARVRYFAREKRTRGKFIYQARRVLRKTLGRKKTIHLSALGRSCSATQKLLPKS